MLTRYPFFHHEKRSRELLGDNMKESKLDEIKKELEALPTEPQLLEYANDREDNE